MIKGSFFDFERIHQKTTLYEFQDDRCGRQYSLLPRHAQFDHLAFLVKGHAGEVVVAL